MSAKTATITGAVEDYSPKFKLLANIARAIGRALNGDVYHKLDAIEEHLVELEAKVQRTDDAREETNAKDARRRAIQFADSLRHGDQTPSEENFNDVMDDITFYEHYCNDHHNFQNEKAVHSINLIKEEYANFLRGEE